MKTTLQTLFSFIFVIGALAMTKVYAQPISPQVYDTPDSYTFTVPANVTSLQIECWGGGGRGASRTSGNTGGGGGGGGAYAITNALPVTPGDFIYITVGAGSTTTSAGGASFARKNVTGSPANANEGARANGGASVGNVNPGGNGATAGIGDVIRSGGSGGAGNTGGSGGGGSSAGTLSNGNNGGANGGAGGAQPIGGGAGGDGQTSSDHDGNPGIAPGGGGGGSKRSSGSRVGGKGGDGQVIITWVVSAGTPNITVSTTSLTGFNYIFGNGPSSQQSFSISGSDLTEDITITPPTNYEISTTPGVGFTATDPIVLGQAGGTIYVRLKAGLSVGNYNSENITATSTGATTRTVTCSGSVTVPTINVSSTSLSGFTYVFGSGPSTQQSFSISGTSLTNNISITPPANYEISLTSGVGFSATDPINLIPSSGTVSATTIYVRLKAGLSTGNYNSENITATSTGATTRTVTCSGSVTAAVPTITTGTISGSPFCVTSANGAAVSVNYSTTGTFNGGNVFSAQLSGPTGVFPATPNVIGTGTSPILATIPAGTPAGSGYRIRVVASDPSTTGTDNGTGLTVITAPSNITGLSGTSQENQVPLSWTNPTSCVEQILVVASTSSSIGGPPTGTPTANANFGSGTALLGGFAVYSGTGTSVTVNGLTNGTTYFFKVFTRFGSVWSAGVQTSVTPSAPPERGDVLIGWDLANKQGNAVFILGDEYDIGVSNIDPSGRFERNNSVLSAGSNTSASYRTINYPNNLLTIEQAVAANSYFTLTVTPNPGYLLEITNIEFIFIRSSDGPRKLQLRSSTDNFATFSDFGVVSITSTSSEFISFETPGLININQTIVFRLYAYDKGGTSANGRGDFVNNITSMNLNDPNDIVVLGKAVPNTWTGAVSEVWNVAGNWRDGIPSAGSDVLIPQISNPNFNPVIAALSPSVGRITLNTGAHLTIAGDGALTVNTEIKNNGVVNVNSGGALVQGVNSTNTGTGTYNIRRQGHTNSQYYNFWSTAVQNTSIGVLGGNRYYFDPTTSTATTADDANDPGWKSASGTMTVGQGYASTGAGLVNFSGNVLNNAPTAFPISASINKGGADNIGNNLIGNPFPSAISISQFLTNNTAPIASAANRIEGSVYFWNQQTTPPFTSADYTIVNGSGAVEGGPNNQLPENYTTIPSGQGFFVIKTNAGAGTVQFRNSQRVAGTNAHFYDVTDISRLWLSVTTPQMKYNETLIAFKEDATAGVDNMYDSKKLSGNNFSIALHSFIDDEKYAIQTLPKLNELQSIQLGLLGDEIGTFTIALKNMEQFNQGTIVVLEDTKLNHFHNLSLQAQYAYERTANDDEKRFRLHFYAPPVSLSLSSCEQNTNKISVNNPTSLIWDVTLENEAGAVVAQTELNGVAEYSFDNLSTGNYKIKFSNASGVQFDLYESVEALDIADASFTINNGQSNILPYEAITAQVNNPAINATYEWYLNGLLAGTGNSVSFAVSDAGSYALRLVATTEDCRNDASLNFSVENTTTSINQLNKDLNVRAFPNPANEMVTIVWNSESTNFERLSIQDISGRTIQVIQLGGRQQGSQIQIDLTDYSEGLYMISLEGGDVRKTVKISVVK
jgi:hypothetical protein